MEGLTLFFVVVFFGLVDVDDDIFGFFVWTPFVEEAAVSAVSMLLGHLLSRIFSARCSFD
jgi:hypothetical protein